MTTSDGSANGANRTDASQNAGRFGRRGFMAGSAAAALSAAVVGSAVAPSAAANTRRQGVGHPLPESTIAARIKLFGLENVDKATGALPDGRVVFAWLSNSSFAAAICGRLVYLDTYITRLEVEPGRTPIVIADLVNAKPDAIFLGHGHGDHADNAAYIAAKTDATIYASEETCGVMAADLERMKADPLIQSDPATRIADDAIVRTVPVTTSASVPGTQIVKLDVLEPFAQVVAFRHLHSVAVPQDPTYPPPRTVIELDPRDPALFPQGTPLTPGQNPQPGQMNLRTGGSPGGEVSLYFHVTLRQFSQFSFGWQNSAGALREGKGRGWDGTPEDGQRIRDLLASLPATDLHLATAASGNYNNNGLRDLIDYQSVLRPKIFIPNHLTTGSVVRESASMSVYAGYVEQQNLMSVPVEDRPDIRWLVDPVDYIEPIAFEADDDAWANKSKKDKIRALDRLSAAQGRSVPAKRGAKSSQVPHDDECGE